MIDTKRRIREIIAEIVSDYLDGLTEFEDVWDLYDLVFDQFQDEEPDHDEGELELLQAVIQDETDRYLRSRGVKLPSEQEEWE